MRTASPIPPRPQVDTIPDPVRAFLEGFNPEDDDFFAHPPDRTDLLRMRLDVDGDGRPDLAVSESSMFGIGAGPWLLFRRLPTKGYRYLGEIFAGPGALRAERVGGASELVAGTPLSAELTHLVRYRVTPDTVVSVAEHDSSGVMTSAGPGLEHCPLLIGASGLLPARCDALEDGGQLGKLREPGADTRQGVGRVVDHDRDEELVELGCHVRNRSHHTPRFGRCALTGARRAERTTRARLTEHPRSAALLGGESDTDPAIGDTSISEAAASVMGWSSGAVRNQGQH